MSSYDKQVENTCKQISRGWQNVSRQPNWWMWEMSWKELIVCADDEVFRDQNIYRLSSLVMRWRVSDNLCGKYNPRCLSISIGIACGCISTYWTLNKYLHSDSLIHSINDYYFKWHFSTFPIAIVLLIERENCTLLMLNIQHHLQKIPSFTCISSSDGCWCKYFNSMILHINLTWNYH